MPLGSFVTYNRTVAHVDPAIVSEETFIASGTWVVPDDVYEISAVCVGGGGGGFGSADGGGGGAGGDLRWRNRIPVTPGQILTITVGAGGTPGIAGVAAGAGGETNIKNGSLALLSAAGGAAGANSQKDTGTLPAQKAQNGTSTAISLPLIGGGVGGRGGWEEGVSQAGGGGGAAGYLGNGGSGGHADETVTFRSIFGV